MNERDFTPDCVFPGNWGLSVVCIGLQVCLKYMTDTEKWRRICFMIQEATDISELLFLV